MYVRIVSVGRVGVCMMWGLRDPRPRIHYLLFFLFPRNKVEDDVGKKQEESEGHEIYVWNLVCLQVMCKRPMVDLAII